MKILVTGASGFIGKSLISELSKRKDFTLYALSRTSVFNDNNNCIPVTVDMTKENWAEAIPSNVDVVVHLAQSRRYREFPEGAVDMLRINVDATLELLEWSRQNGVKRFLFASTGNVYKRSPELHAENDECVPESMYDATKLSAEYIVRQYGVFFQTVIMRIFGVYGPNQENYLIPYIIKCITTGKEIVLAKGKGLYITPIYISDCAEMIGKLISIPHGKSDIYNLAGNESLHLGEITDMIAEQLGIKPSIVLTDDEPKNLRGSNEKICSTIRYQPEVTFSEGIRKTLAEGNWK